MANPKINHLKLNGTVYDLTTIVNIYFKVDTDGWQEKEQNGFTYYTKTIQNFEAGYTPLQTDSPFVDVDMQCFNIQTSDYDSVLDSYACINRVVMQDGKCTLYAYGDTPSVQVPIILRCIR